MLPRSRNRRSNQISFCMIYYISAVNCGTGFSLIKQNLHVSSNGIIVEESAATPCLLGLALFAEISTPESLKSRDRLDNAVFHRLLLWIPIYHEEVGAAHSKPRFAARPFYPFIPLHHQLSAPFRDNGTDSRMRESVTLSSSPSSRQG